MKLIFLMMFALTGVFAFQANAQQQTNVASSEDALKVQPELYEPPLKIDTKTVQRQVYKTIYKQDMKETRPTETSEEE